MSVSTSPATSANGPSLESEKYVLFRLAGETFGLSLLELQEVIANYDVTVLPNLPPYFHGVIGLRREVIPVLDLRSRLGFAAKSRDRSTRAIVLDLEPNPIALEVDEVLRVRAIRRDAIESAPVFSGDQRAPFVSGVSEQTNGKLVIHLDVQRILSSLDQIELAEIAADLREAFDAREARPEADPAAGDARDTTGAGGGEDAEDAEDAEDGAPDIRDNPEEQTDPGK
jgi:purine-binding chemotaxis protein CheW